MGNRVTPSSVLPSARTGTFGWRKGLAAFHAWLRREPAVYSKTRSADSVGGGRHIEDVAYVVARAVNGSGGTSDAGGTRHTSATNAHHRGGPHSRIFIDEHLWPPAMLAVRGQRHSRNARDKFSHRMSGLRAVLHFIGSGARIPRAGEVSSVSVGSNARAAIRLPCTPTRHRTNNSRPVPHTGSNDVLLQCELTSTKAGPPDAWPPNQLLQPAALGAMVNRRG